MKWEEKVEILKKQFNPADFNVPFTDWVDIMKNIEGSFIKKQNSNSHFNNWSDNIRQKNPIEVIAFSKLQDYLTRLGSNNNYWAIMVSGDSQSSQHQVYDCKLGSLQALVSLSLNDFFIVNKKYKWFTYFYRGKTNNEIMLFKSGNSITPFENKHNSGI